MQPVTLQYQNRYQVPLPGTQRGALMVLVLLVLLVVSLLGMSSMDATGLEMKMSSNAREQQVVFESAEYALSTVEDLIQTTGFSDGSLLGDGTCGTICFDATCSGGYCFNDFGDITNVPTSIPNCAVGSPAEEVYESPDVWNDDSSDGSHHLAIDTPSGLTAMYIVEFRCYAPENPAETFDAAATFSKVYRITAFVIGESGKSRVMLRSTMKDFE